MAAQFFNFVVIGGGVAGATAVETLRSEGATGSIVLLSAEHQLPYQRGPLSKTFLTSKHMPPPSFVLSAERYDELAVQTWLGTCVMAIEPQRKILHTVPHGEIAYGQLLIATGITPRRLNLPGEGLARIHCLHTLPDDEAIRSSAQSTRHAVVIGGSFTGLEVAASLRQRGIAVTVIERQDLLHKLHTPDISAFFHQRLKEQGVEVLVDDAPAEFLGTEQVEAVRTYGGRTIACDMVVIGAGSLPKIDFLADSGIEVQDGIVVDRFLQTNQPDVFAAGDVANFFDPVFNRRRRIEHWDNAVKQGRLAARNMLGRRLPYDEVSYFYSHIFNLSFNMLGLIEPPYERIDRGSLASGSCASFYQRDDVPIALFALGRPSAETRAMESLIKHKVNLKRSKHRLSDPQFELTEIPTQTIFILQGGGALGAFEYGAVRALEESGIRPDVVAGVSIGAFNGAVIASHPEHPAQALQAFWADLATQTPDWPDDNVRRWLVSSQIAFYGVQNFFQPRWLLPTYSPEQWPHRWTSLYDTSAARQLLLKHVDFARLKTSPIRLMVSAVDIETSELVVFDSYVDELTPEHILASGSLPPSFPWTTIEGRHYWDGGIVSNSPLDRVVERCGSAGKQVFIIDLFPGKRTALPQNLAEVMARRDEIVYSERIRSDVRSRDMVRDFQTLVQEVMKELPPETAARVRHEPRFIQMMSEQAPMTITRIVREHAEEQPASGDYDFSARTIGVLSQSGYEMARKALRA